MSWFDGVPGVMLYGGPIQDYPAAAAASASAQNLIAGASGGFSQPPLPFGALPMGKSGFFIEGHLVGIVTGQSTATTMIITVNLSPSTGGTTSLTNLVATPAITVTSLSAATWELDFKAIVRTVGYGTTTVSTTLYTSGNMTVVGGTPLSTLAAPNSVTTIDASVPQWFGATVTFSTSSATNSCTLKQFPVKLWA